MELLPESVQLVYSQLLDELLGVGLPSRGISFVRRAVRGRDYWYMQLVIGSERQAFYLGPDDEATRRRVEANRTLRREAEQAEEVRGRLVTMLRAGGAAVLPASHARVLETLAQAGVFLVGGVLVSSHAFTLLGNALGVRWDAGTARTADVDLAHDRTISAVVPPAPVDLEQAVRATGQPFFPVPALRHDHPSTSFKVRGSELSVSLLTPMIGRPDGSPRPVPTLRAMAEPLRFLEFVLTDTQQVAVPVRQGFLVTTPSPARFALHKLVVSVRRPATFAIKARKDVAQARQVLAFLASERPGDLDLAIDAAREMPQRFQHQLRQAAAGLPDDLATLLCDRLPDAG